MAWSPDGSGGLATRGIAAAPYLVWDAIRGRQLFDIRGHRGAGHRPVMVAGREATGVRGAAGGMARVWDARDGRPLLCGSPPGTWGRSGPCPWSPDGRRLASGSADGTARVWDAEAGLELLALPGHVGFVRSVAWSPDGNRLATGGDDAAAHVWTAADAEAVRRWEDREQTDAGRLARDEIRGPKARGFITDWLVLLPLSLGAGARPARRRLDRPQLPDEAANRAPAARGSSPGPRRRSGVWARRIVRPRRSSISTRSQWAGDHVERRLRRLLHRQRPGPRQPTAPARQRRPRQGLSPTWPGDLPGVHEPRPLVTLDSVGPHLAQARDQRAGVQGGERDSQLGRLRATGGRRRAPGGGRPREDGAVRRAHQLSTAVGPSLAARRRPRFVATAHGRL